MHINSCQKPYCLPFLAHSQYDMRQGVEAQVMGVTEYAKFSLNKFKNEYHMLIQSSNFDHIQLCFPHIFDQSQCLHKFLSQ